MPNRPQTRTGCVGIAVRHLLTENPSERAEPFPDAPSGLPDVEDHLTGRCTDPVQPGLTSNQRVGARHAERNPIGPLQTEFVISTTGVLFVGLS